MIKRLKANPYRWAICGLGLVVLVIGFFLTSTNLINGVVLTKKEVKAAGSDNESVDNTVEESSVVSREDEFLEDYMDPESIYLEYKTGLSQGMLVCVGEINTFLKQLQNNIDTMKRSELKKKVEGKIKSLKKYFKENPQFELHEGLFTDLETIKKEESRKKVKTLIACMRSYLLDMCTPGTTNTFGGQRSSLTLPN